jgi:hypothetical protein
VLDPAVLDPAVLDPAVLDPVEPYSGPGSFGIDYPGTFDPLKEIDDSTTFEIHAMEEGDIKH